MHVDCGKAEAKNSKPHVLVSSRRLEYGLKNERCSPEGNRERKGREKFVISMQL